LRQVASVLQSGFDDARCPPSTPAVCLDSPKRLVEIEVDEEAPASPVALSVGVSSFSLDVPDEGEITQMPAI
jgi:hypothetical protein